MLSNGFDAPLRLKLDPSRLLIQFQLLVHVLAIIAISLPSSVPLAIKLILYVYVVYSAVSFRSKRTVLVLSDRQFSPFLVCYSHAN